MGENEKHSKIGKTTINEILEHTSNSPTIQEVYESMNEDQKNLVHHFVALALQNK